MPFRQSLCLFILAFWATLLVGQETDRLLAYSRLTAITGRETAATEFLRSQLAGLPVQQNALGNLTVTIGSGSPRRLFVVPVDEPGYVITQIQENGYLRIAPVSSNNRSFIQDQYLEGHKCLIQTRNGPVFGAITVPSSHFDGIRPEPVSQRPPFTWHDAFIDVGAANPAEVAAQGIQLMDPVLPEKNPVILQNSYLAAPGARTTFGALSLADAARQVAANPGRGTTVFAWTTLGLLNGKGLESLVNTQDPFDEVYLFSRCFGNNSADRPLASRPINGQEVAVVDGFRPCERYASSSGPQWSQASITHLGLAAQFTDTPVETVALNQLATLTQLWVAVAGGRSRTLGPLAFPALPSVANNQSLPYADLAGTLQELIARYGVSDAEGPVREYILANLPAWAKPVVKEGNIMVTFGQGDEHIAFVAHMDETGFSVDSILPDGRLALRIRGGIFPWVWEGQTALVHTSRGDIPAIFEPRPNYEALNKRSWGAAPLVYLGLKDRQSALNLGIQPGESTVTMIKTMRRIGQNRAVARGFDDRVGCAALLLALQRINPATLTQRVTFCWSVEEEVGLNGAKTLAQQLKGVKRVYPIDTFVSSDDPNEPHNYGYCPLGAGPVLRVLESINFIPQAEMQQTLQLAASKRIPLQTGLTRGGTDGQPFLGYGIPSIPLSWPGRYSHSPVEVMDFRDMAGLVNLIEAIVAQ